MLGRQDQVANSSRERTDKLRACLQVDGFSMCLSNQVYHFVLMVGEASGYAVIREAFRLPEDEHQNLQYLPGDLVYFRRLQHPADLPANNVVDRPRVTNWKMVWTRASLGV